jgi:hypothetical protein
VDELAVGRYALIAVIGAGGPRRSRTRWLIGARMTAAALLVMAVAVAGCGRPGKTTPMVAPERLATILLTVPDVNTVMGASGMQPDAPIAHATQANPVTLSNPDCRGAFLVGQTPVYQGSGSTAISYEKLSELGDNPDHMVSQAAVSFPSADLALAFVKTSAGKWRACAGQSIAVTDNGQDYRWTFGNPVGDVPAITQLRTFEGGNGFACQHVLRAVLNVVLDVAACGDHISDQGARIADKMAGATTQEAHTTPQTTSPPPPPAPMVAPDGLDPILLTVPDVNTMMGASGTQPTGPIDHGTWNSRATLSNPDCLGALLIAQTPVYQGSGYTAASEQVLQGSGNSVGEAAVSFPSADLALAFVKTSAGKWRACAGQITETEEGKDYRWTVGNLVGDVPAITQLRTPEAGSGTACQRVLRAVLNVVLDVVACDDHISDQAGRIAEKMAATAAQQAH